MKEEVYHLVIDEKNATVSFSANSIKGAKAGLKELRRQKKLFTLQRRGRFARLRENRSSYWGAREVSRSIRGNWLSELIQTWARFSAFTKTSKNDYEIAHLDRILIAIDRAILDLESEIESLKS